MVKLPEKWQRFLDLPDDGFIDALKEHDEIPHAIINQVRERINALKGSRYDEASRAFERITSHGRPWRTNRR